MNVLAFDTCLAMCSAAVGTAVGKSGQMIQGRAEPMATGHAERLIPMIGEVLEMAGLAVRDIDLIATTNGPGSFTGTRIAVSAARALALATGRPIVALSSLHLIALDPAIGPLSPHQDLLVAMNASRGEVFAQRFDGTTRAAKGPPLLITAADAARLCEEGALAVGSGTELLARAVDPARGAIEARHAGVLPNACNMIVVAASSMPLAETLRPLYLRPPDARPQAGKSLARAP